MYGASAYPGLAHMIGPLLLRQIQLAIGRADQMPGREVWN